MELPNRNSKTVENPVFRYYEYSGKQGKYYYYDKDRKENVYSELPFTFLYLTETACVSGFSDEHQTGYFSNEINPYNAKTDELNVRLQNSGRTVQKGLWSEIKGSLQGAKFTKSIYAVCKIDGEYKIVNIKLSGSGFGNWGELKNKFKGAITVKATQSGKKGANEYQMPIYETIPTSPEADLFAKEATDKVVEYLTQKMRGQELDVSNEIVETPVTETPVTETPDFELQDFLEDDLPF